MKKISTTQNYHSDNPALWHHKIFFTGTMRERVVFTMYSYMAFFLWFTKKKTTSTQNFKWDICPLNMRRTGRKMKNSLNVSLDVSLRLLIAEPACFYSTAQSESQTNRTWRLMDTGVREQGSVISPSDWWNWMEAAVQWWRARVNNLRQHRRHSHKQTNEGEKQGRMKKKKKKKKSSIHLLTPHTLKTT